MEIQISKVSVYQKVEIIDENTTLNLGLFDLTEAEDLATQFRDAADELYPIEEGKEPNESA